MAAEWTTEPHGPAEVGADEGASRLVALIKIVAPAKPEIDRHEHQSGPMGNRHRKRPQAQLRRPDPRQRARMAPVQQPEYAEADDKKARADLDLPPPFGKGHEQREGKQNEEHGEEMAGSQRPQRRQSAREFRSISPAETASGQPMPGLTP